MSSPPSAGAGTKPRPKMDLSAFQWPKNVCRKLTCSQKTFVNGTTIAFDRLAVGASLHHTPPVDRPLL